MQMIHFSTRFYYNIQSKIVGKHLQVVLSFESFAANVAHVLPFVAVCQLVFGQCRRVPKHFPAGLKHTNFQRFY